MARKDLLTRLADAGEEAIARLGDAPGADRLLGVVNTMRDRMDELQRRVRGLESLDRRVAALERRLDEAGIPAAALEAPADDAESAAGEPSAAEEPTQGASPASETTHSGSQAEPVGPATQGASQVGNPTDENV